jgi:D-glycero-alpha-D-manno-heptose-7-phosphate kinase
MIISRTPVRLSFFGGGTDYPEYFEREKCAVLGTTIDKYTYVTINRGSPFFDHKIRVGYSKAELVNKVEDIQHPSVRETLKFLKMDEHLDIHIFADLPAKTGLGSSSTFTVGFLNACYAYRGTFASKERLAREAILIERERIGENVGIQDQTHAAYGGMNIIRADRNGIKVTPVVMPQKNKELLESSLMLFYTGITRFASEVVQEQITRTKSLELDDYLTRMHDQVDEGQRILANQIGEGMLESFGKLLHEGWEMKKRLSTQVTTSKIDEYYQVALKAGATGGKVGGAGGGGFLMLIVKPERQQAVRTALKDLLEVQFGFDNQGTSIIYSYEPPRYGGAK